MAQFSPLFLEHYSNAFHFPGGHTPTEQEVKTWYAPLATKMLIEFSVKYNFPLFEYIETISSQLQL